MKFTKFAIENSIMIPQKSFIPIVSEIATKWLKTTKQATPRTATLNWLDPEIRLKLKHIVAKRKFFSSLCSFALKTSHKIFPTLRSHFTPKLAMVIVFITAIDFLDFRWRILIRFLYSLPRRAFRHVAGIKQKVNTRRHVGDYDNICRRNFKTPASIVWCQVWGSCPWLSTSCVKKFPINCAGLPKHRTYKCRCVH